MLDSLHTNTNAPDAENNQVMTTGLHAHEVQKEEHKYEKETTGSALFSL